MKGGRAFVLCGVALVRGRNLIGGSRLLQVWAPVPSKPTGSFLIFRVEIERERERDAVEGFEVQTQLLRVRHGTQPFYPLLP